MDISKDLKIIQDTRILQTMLDRFPSSGNQINVIYVNQLLSEVPSKKENANDLKILENYIDSLPQPRLKNLIKQAIAIAMSKFSNDEEAGKWLGGSRRLINFRKKNILESKEDSEK